MPRRHAFIAALLIGLAARFVCAQERQAGPLSQFEVATVKPSDPNQAVPRSIRMSPDRFEARGETLKALIAMAYDLPTYSGDQQISGGPAWIGSDPFDVDARMDEPLMKELEQQPLAQRGQQYRLMLQKLLADHFQLRLHRETKQLPVYALVVNSGGPKLKTAILNPQLPANIPQSRVNIRGQDHLEGHDCDIAMIVKVLNGQPEVGGRPIVDKTELTGRYDFTLQWASEAATDLSPGAAGTAKADGDWPAFFTAVQEQLGLRLVPTKAPVEVLVIDSIDRPSEN